MARKSPGDLSPAYARRLARAEAAGKSRQAARGHRAGEHIVRRAGGARKLSPDQVKDAERLARAVKGTRGAERAAIVANEARLAKRREAARERHRQQVAREKWNGVLTDKDKRYARHIGRAWRFKLTPEGQPAISADDAARRGLERMQRIGPDFFRAAVKRNRAMYRQYLAEVAAGTYASRGWGFLVLLAEEDKERDVVWYFYHSYS